MHSDMQDRLRGVAVGATIGDALGMPLEFGPAIRLDRPVREQLVVLGEMSVQGLLLKVGSLSERLQLALECGAKQVLVPSENKRDLADLPDSVLNKLQVSFYTDPLNAAIRAMGLE